MTKLLASVRTAAEAQAAIDGGADIIDLKEPAAGALGRLPIETLQAIVRTVGHRRPTSATIGDVPLVPQMVTAAVRDTAATGVDIVKIGIFAGDIDSTLSALERMTANGIRIVAVFFADRLPDFGLIARCADARFHGAMLDTADKRAGSLTRHVSLERLAEFIDLARARGLLAGFAGSLARRDLPALLPLAPDFLGFRSALTAGERGAPLDPEAFRRLRAALDDAAARSPTATAGAHAAVIAASVG